MSSLVVVVAVVMVVAAAVAKAAVVDTASASTAATLVSSNVSDASSGVDTDDAVFDFVLCVDDVEQAADVALDDGGGGGGALKFSRLLALSETYMMSK